MSEPKAMYDRDRERVVWRCHGGSFEVTLAAANEAPVVGGYRLEEVRIRRRGRGARTSLSLFYQCVDRRQVREDPCFWERELAGVATLANR